MRIRPACPATQPATNHAWRRIAPVVIGWVFFDRLIGVFTLPDLDASSFATAAVVGGSGLVWASIGWGAGGLTDRFGGGATAAGALAAGAVLAAASAAAPDANAFAVARVLGAAAQVSVVAAVSAALGVDRLGFGRAVGVSFSTTRLSGAVAPAVVALSTTLGTWRFGLALDAAIGAALAVLVWRVRERPVDRVRVAHDRRFLVTRGGVVGGLIAVPALCVTLTVAGLVTVDGSAFSSTGLQVAFALGASIATFAAGALADSYGPWRVSVAGLLAGMGGALWLAAGGPVAIGLVGLVAAAGVVAIGLVMLPLLDAPAHRYGMATALPRTLAELIGGGVAAAGLVTIGRWAGPEAAFAGLAALLIVFLVAASAVGRGEVPTRTTGGRAGP